MSKIILTLLLFLSFSYSILLSTTTETFEDQTAGQTTFSEGGTSFSLTGNFQVLDYYGGGYGYNASDFLIDNTGRLVTSGTDRLIGTIYCTNESIKTTSCWVFTSEGGIYQNSGTVKFKWYNGANLLGTQSYSVPTVSPIVAPAMGFHNIIFGPTESNYSANKIEVYVVSPLQYIAIDNFAFDIAVTATAPTVTTQAVSSIAITTATGNGNVTSTGGANVTERGIYYSTTDGFADGTGTKVSTTGDWGSTGAFTEAITGLTPSTTYYVKAFATNSAGTGYGAQVSFATLACTNPSSGGTIATTQLICSGSAPVAFTSSTLPSGHTGTLEYKWQSSTTSSTAGFVDIGSSNSATYSPGILNATTWYKRLARVDCKSDWTGAAESNVILVKINQKPADQTVSPASQTIISGNSATISIGSSESSTCYYLRDNTNNAVVDGPKSGTGSTIDFNTGNLSSTKTFNVYAEKIHALNFDGVNDYVSVNHTFPAFNNYTLSAWVYLTDGSNAKIFSSLQYELAVISGKVQLFISGRSGITGTADLTLNQWNYVSVTFNGTSLSIYINGNLDKSVATSVDVLQSVSFMTIGKHFSVACCYVNGYLGELSFESNSHTQAEIQSKMMNGYTDDEDGLVAYYKFGDGTGSTTLTDRTANNFNGTLVNMNTQTAWISDCSEQMSPTATVTVITLPTVTTQDVSSISITTATGNGNITSLGSPNPTAYGVVYHTSSNPTTSNSVVDNGVASASGAFTANMTTLTPNTLYYVRAYATNTVDPVYGEEVEFRTLAAVPTAPTVNGATATTLDVTVNVNGNPAGTLFAIQEEISGDYIQSDDGALEATEDWQTAATWGTKTVTGLSVNTQYTFKAKARNGESTPVETAFGGTASLYTLANDPGTPTVDNPSPTTLDVTLDVNSNPADTEFAIQETGGNYVQANGSLAGGVVWQNAATWNSPITVTGLTPATEYTFKAIARNGNNVTTAFGGSASLYTFSTEPTNHATNLNYVSPTTISSIILTWVDAVGGTLPDSYIIKASTADDIVAPIDGTTEEDGVLVKNVAYGAETVEFTGLNSGTTYYFKIYPYRGTNTTVNYKTDGVVPMVTCSTLVAYPTEQATNITFSNITRTSMTVKWTRGNGDGSVLLGKEKYRIPASILTNGDIYENASSVYTSAPAVSGTKVLYWGTSASPSVSVTGLTRYQLIYFKVCEFNDVEDPKYLQTENATNPGSRWTLRRDGWMEEDLTLDAEFAYPNPATNSISTTLDVYEEGNVSATLYDIEGRKVIELYNQTLPFGTHELSFDISNVSSGVYQLIMTKGSEAIAYPVAVAR